MESLQESEVRRELVNAVSVSALADGLWGANLFPNLVFSGKTDRQICFYNFYILYLYYFDGLFIFYKFVN